MIVMKESSAVVKVLNRSSLGFTSLEGTTCKLNTFPLSFFFIENLKQGHLSFCVYRVLIGEVDNDLDARLNLAEIRAEPLTQIHH